APRSSARPLGPIESRPLRPDTMSRVPAHSKRRSEARRMTAGNGKNGDAEALSFLSAGFLEGLYADFLRDPSTVDPQWRSYFERLVREEGRFAQNPRLSPSFRAPSLFGTAGVAHPGRGESSIAVLQDRLDQLVRAYRVRGHMVAGLDPLGMPRPSV